MMSLYHQLRKCTGVYKFTKLQKKFKHLMDMDGIKLMAKNEKKNQTWRLKHWEYRVRI